MRNEDKQTVKADQVNYGQEQEPEEIDTANRWIPVALKLAVANAEEEARSC